MSKNTTKAFRRYKDAEEDNFSGFSEQEEEEDSDQWLS